MPPARLSRVEPHPRRSSLILLLAIALLGAFCALTKPGSTAWIPECPFHALTGLYCAGCGTLRALHCLLTGDIGSTVRCNALLLPALVLLLAGIAGDLASPGGGLFRAGSRSSMIIGACFLVVSVVFSILRNLPFAGSLQPV